MRPSIELAYRDALGATVNFTLCESSSKTMKITSYFYYKIKLGRTIAVASIEAIETVASVKNDFCFG
jgi:hypothetical protein